MPAGLSPAGQAGDMRIDQEIFRHMKIPNVHIERIRGFSYTESEARFLYIVAVFSGYFTLAGCGESCV